MTSEIAPPIQTKWGTAKCYGSHGYYRIVTKDKGCFYKQLHRLIIEDFYNTTLPDDWVVHHNDGNPLNNEIWNLIPMPRREHVILHVKGIKRSHETIEKIRAGRIGEKSWWYDKHHDLSSKIKISSSGNTTGFFRVNKHFKKDCAQGFYWEYQYYDENKYKSFCSVNLLKLKQKVIQNGLEWLVLDLDNALKTIEENNLELEVLL